MRRVGVFVRLCRSKDSLKRHSCSLTIKTIETMDSEEEPIHTSPAFYAVVKRKPKTWANSSPRTPYRRGNEGSVVAWTTLGLGLLR